MALWGWVSPDALPCCCSWFFSSDVSLPGPTLLESPELALLLGHREELRDARCLRFWEIDRWRFLMEELAAMVTTQGWRMAWSAVRRAAGSNGSRRWIKSLARLDTEGQGCGIEEAGQSDLHQCEYKNTQSRRCQFSLHTQTLWNPQSSQSAGWVSRPVTPAQIQSLFKAGPEISF